jgi:8-oxo-dGTP pyrophosphatase MutT (NUDIX family)
MLIGLVDPIGDNGTEKPEDAAIRELKEETGYIGKVVNVSPILSYEPGIIILKKV